MQLMNGCCCCRRSRSRFWIRWLSERLIWRHAAAAVPLNWLLELCVCFCFLLLLLLLLLFRIAGPLCRSIRYYIPELVRGVGKSSGGGVLHWKSCPGYQVTQCPRMVSERVRPVTGAGQCRLMLVRRESYIYMANTAVVVVAVRSIKWIKQPCNSRSSYLAAIRFCCFSVSVCVIVCQWRTWVLSPLLLLFFHHSEQLFAIDQSTHTHTVMRSCGCLFVEEMTIEAEVEMEMYAAASFWPHCLRTLWQTSTRPITATCGCCVAAIQFNYNWIESSYYYYYDYDVLLLVVVKGREMMTAEDDDDDVDVDAVDNARFWAWSYFLCVVYFYLHFRFVCLFIWFVSRERKRRRARVDAGQFLAT